MYSKGNHARERVLEAAAALFARQGYAGTSLRQIAQAAEMSQGNLYHYFRRKDDIFLAIWHSVNDEVNEQRSTILQTSDHPELKLKNFVTLTMNNIAKNYDRQAIILHEWKLTAPADNEQLIHANAENFDILMHIVDAGVSCGIFRPISRQRILSLYYSISCGIIDALWNGVLEVDMESFTADVCELLLSVLRPQSNEVCRAAGEEVLGT